MLNPLLELSGNFEKEGSLNDASPSEWDKVRDEEPPSFEEYMGWKKKHGDQPTALSTQVGGGHYKECGIQPIEFIHANDLSYCEANIVKYATRHRLKGKAEDIRKVIHYAELLLELEYGEG